VKAEHIDCSVKEEKGVYVCTGGGKKREGEMGERERR